MEIFLVQPGGAYRAALYFALLPLVLVALVLLVKRTQAIAKTSLLERFGYLPLLVMLAAYYGLIWQWLFYGQFYAVLDDSETQWRLEYLAPKRHASIDVARISSISKQNAYSATGASTTARLLVEMDDGRVLRSAQMAYHKAEDHLQRLRAAAEHDQE